MTLDEYLTSEDIPAAEFGSLVNLSEASISRIRKGDQNLSRDVMRRIIAASDGKITAAGLVHPGPTAIPSPVPSAGKAGEISTGAAA